MLNLQINSLEQRKNTATQCIELMTDLRELDASVKMVQRALDTLDIETASHFFGKVIMLVNVIQPRLQIRDLSKFDNLKQ